MLPVAVATFCWGASFYCGCKNVDRVQASLYANHILLQLKQGSHPEQPPHPDLTDAAIRGVHTALVTNGDNAKFYADWQFRFLIAGAIFFIVWHVAGLARLS